MRGNLKVIGTFIGKTKKDPSQLKKLLVVIVHWLKVICTIRSFVIDNQKKIKRKAGKPQSQFLLSIK